MADNDNGGGGCGCLGFIILFLIIGLAMGMNINEAAEFGLKWGLGSFAILFGAVVALAVGIVAFNAVSGDVRQRRRVRNLRKRGYRDQ